MIGNNRAENSHLPIRRRERKQQKFKSQASAQRFLATHASRLQTLHTQPHLTTRRTLRILRYECIQNLAGSDRRRMTAAYRLAPLRPKRVNLTLPIDLPELRNKSLPLCIFSSPLIQSPFDLLPETGTV